jgi:galactokinase/mevalonate kinase-like predicted kinase
MRAAWDYLLLTASHQTQARAYQDQLRLRQELGLLPQVGEALVVADPEGRRVGSGGSTLYCLMQVLDRERERGRSGAPDEVLRGLRILILHAGGDSQRLPAYGPCGKIFVPVPGESHSALACALFDRLAPGFLALPPGPEGAGQVVVASGDALLLCDAPAVEFSTAGMIALGCFAPPEEAARHGVFCVARDGVIDRYLQKPSLEEQAAAGAIDPYGQAVLDAGVMSLDARAAVTLLNTFGAAPDSAGKLAWPEANPSAISRHGLDLYREICCALGRAADFTHYLRSARSSGSTWNEETLARFFAGLREIPFHVQVLARCSFLHFGASAELVPSGLGIIQHDTGLIPASPLVGVNNEVAPGGSVTEAGAWVEGSRIRAPLELGGRNVVVGVDVDQPLRLPEGACLDVIYGHDRRGEAAWFVRCYGVEDAFKDSAEGGGLFCGRPLREWLALAGAAPEDVFDAGEPAGQRTLWSARVFPAEQAHAGYRRWLWMFDPAAATPEQRRAFLSADRYSAAEIAWRADQEAFHRRRAGLRAQQVGRQIGRMFRPESRFSAEDLAFCLKHAPDRAALLAKLLATARHLAEAPDSGGLENFRACRLIHSVGSAIAQVEDFPAVSEWSERLHAAAFRKLNQTILGTRCGSGQRPRHALRPDETIWGRAPARIELGGGWTDTPPYTLEYGGDVANAAVNLNGQPPIHCYCRVVEEPLIRLSSIDAGLHVEVATLDELLDYRRPESSFALAKAALALSGFAPDPELWPAGISLREMLEEFGGGLELTTLVGIPKGSGLGTSSILGAVILAVIGRLLGRPLSQRELFHDVLRLEQALTTGGGWQDQIGGGTGGAKVTSTAPGLIPDPRIRYLPDDVLDPQRNGGSTLLYYTGLTRLAKHILEKIVGGYLNRDRRIMAALAEEHRVAHAVADAMSAKDAARFGHCIDAAWELQKTLCGQVTNPSIEQLLAAVRPYVHGMRISGAGSGGFLLMICRSPADAHHVRELLAREPLNDRARFFDFQINHAGLEVTTC